MRIQYFSDTDTLLLTFNKDLVVETKELDEDTYIDINSNGKLVSLTIEHAGQRTDLSKLKIEGIVA